MAESGNLGAIENKAERKAASVPPVPENCGTNLVDLARSVKENAVAPALNSLAIEPVNAGLNIVNGISHGGTWATNKIFGTKYEAPEVSKLSELAVSRTEAGSAGYYSQQILGTAGSFLAYAVAGKIAGKTLSAASELAPAEMTLAKMQAGTALRAFANDARVATVIGATGYAALKDPHAGETRLSNAAGTFVSFTAFEVGNSQIGAGSPFRFGQRYVVGSLGGTAQANITSLILNGKLADKDTVSSSALAGGLLNAIMPAGKTAVDHGEARIGRLTGSRKVSEGALKPESIELPLKTDGKALSPATEVTTPSRVELPTVKQGLDRPPEIPPRQTADVPHRITPLTETLDFVRSGNSLVGARLSEGQAKLLDLLETSHKAATKLDGVEITSRREFSEPTKLTEGPMAGANVTSVTEYANGIKIYENQNGITMDGKPDYYGKPTRMVTDHDTFIKKEYGPKRMLPEGVGGGATVESVYEFRHGGAAYVNDAGLFGPSSERALLQNYDSRLRLFDKSDEAGFHKPDPQLDAQVAKIVDNFSAAKVDARIEKLIEEFPESDRAYAKAFLEMSQPFYDGNRMMAHYRDVGGQAANWFELNKGPHQAPLVDAVYPAADESAVALGYISGKSRTGFKAYSTIGKSLENASRTGMEPEALVIFGDAGKLSAEEISALQQRQKDGLKLALYDNLFDRGVNAIDSHLGNARPKLEGLIEAAKREQSQSGGTPEQAARAVLTAPAEKLAGKLQLTTLGRDSNASVGQPSGPGGAGEAPDVLAARIKSYFEEKYPLTDDQVAVSNMFSSGLRYYDFDEMLGRLQTLHHYIGDGASGADPLYIVDPYKSQGFINFLYRRVNGVDADKFVNAGDLKKLPAGHAKDRPVVLLDDAAYSGAQIEDNVENALHYTNYENPVIVGNLAAYQKAYARTSHIEGMQMVSTESVMPFYDVSGYRAETSGSQNGVTNSNPLEIGSLSKGEVDFLRQASLFEFNRGGTWGRMGNRLIFFYKQADSTPKFIGKFLEDFFHIEC